MRSRSRAARWMAMAWACAALLLARVETTRAQTLFLGRIDVAVADTSAAVLPGVTVTIDGPQQQTLTTDDRGEAHFLNLAPGRYAVVATLSGFQRYENRQVQVGSANTVPLRLTLAPGGVQESVQVVADAPVLDSKHQTTTTSISYDELQNTPSSRDPWVVLQTVPGVIVDRVNVGGAESGQQSNYIAKGASVAENTWNVEGVPITDLAATGSSPTYYNFDMFQEMSVTTGGASLSNPTAGVQLNMQLKSGTNAVHGSVHDFYANSSLQGDNLPAELASLAGPSGKGNRLDSAYDAGFDLGGPLLRNRWWAWGSYGQTDGTVITLSDVPDRTQLKNIAFKSEGQLSQTVRASFLYFRGNKEKIGRNAGPTRPAETTWDQSGPAPLYKGQVNLTLKSNLFVTGRVAYVHNGFSFTPEGGLTPSTYRDNANVYHGSYYQYATDRPDKSALFDGSYFHGAHEITFGGGWRKVRDNEELMWPGNGAVSFALSSYPRNGAMLVDIYRPLVAASEAVSQQFYVGDSISLKRVTITAGLRFDRTSNSGLESHQPANAGFADLLPAITAPALPDAIHVKLLTPRVGITYALDEARKTQLRASYGMFGTQLGSGLVQGFSASGQAIVEYFATDTNGNHIADRNELTDLGGFQNVDPDHPDRGVNFNRIDPNLKSPKTHELIVGIDREVTPSLTVSAAFTYRRMTDLIWQDPTGTYFPLIGVKRSDYVLEDTLTGNATGIGNYNANLYTIPDSALPDGNGIDLRTRDGYHQRYVGFEVQAAKRMANHWMARLAFSTNNHREYFDDPSASIQDPTQSVIFPNQDGAMVLVPTAGSGKSEIYMVLPRYQITGTGFYQAPWGIGIGANLTARQGFGEPFYDTVDSSDQSSAQKSVLLVNADQYRLPTLVSLDMRAEKAFTIQRVKLAVDLDIFNVGNRATVLGREYDLSSASFNQVREIMNPRVARLGLRMTF
jgi:hypothetical protein